MYFALHNNDNRAVLNRMKVNQVHVWQDSWGGQGIEFVQIFWSRGSVVFLREGNSQLQRKVAS